MSYQLGHVELGDAAGLSYCSKAAPKPGCVPIPGVVVPMDTHTLLSFKALQVGINRILVYYKLGGLIGIDGRIGSGTLSAYKRAIAAVRLTGQWIHTNVDSLAAGVDAAMVRLNEIATGLGVTYAAGQIPPTSSTRPSVPGPNNTVINPEPTLLEKVGLGGGGGSNTMLLVGVAAVGGFLYFRGKKKRRR